MKARQGSRVAVVDDDPELLESLSDLLESVGYTALAFPSAQALLDSGSLREVDCLISDIRMTGVDGWQLKSLAHQQQPRLPVILITAHDPQEDIPRGSQLMQDLHALLRKPFDGRVLLAAVQEALARKDG